MNETRIIIMVSTAMQAQGNGPPQPTLMVALKVEGHHDENPALVLVALEQAKLLLMQQVVGAAAPRVMVPH